MDVSQSLAKRAQLLFVIILPILCAHYAPAQATQEEAALAKNSLPSEQSMRELIQQLADPSYDKREAASSRLTAIGAPAWDLIRAAASQAADAETRHRLKLVQRAIGKTLFTQVRQLEGHNEGKQPWVTRVVVTPDGRRAISVGTDAVRSWDLATGEQAVSFEERKGAYCWGLAISADGSRLIVGSHDGLGDVFEVASGTRVCRLLGHKGAIWGVALTADGKQALSGGVDRKIRVWDADTGKQLRAFAGVVEDVRCLALAPDGKLVAAGHFRGNNQPGIIRLWDFAKGEEIRALHGHTMEVASVSFSADGSMLVSTSFDKSVRIWNVATGKELRYLSGHTSRSENAAFTPDGKRVVSSGNAWNCSLRLWDVATGEQLLDTEELKAGL